MKENYQKVRMTLTQILMGFAAIFFFQDVVLDIFSHIHNHELYTIEQLAHLIFEIAAVLALSIGLIDSLSYTKSLRNQNHSQSQSLYYLREDFDAFMKEKFAHWELSPAERDIALLLLKGLPTDKIASLRNVASGTIKVQSHRVFQKAGVGSRIELMSLFMEEFIDIGIGVLEAD